jgi:hypothetical protein
MPHLPLPPSRPAPTPTRLHQLRCRPSSSSASVVSRRSPTSPRLVASCPLGTLFPKIGVSWHSTSINHHDYSYPQLPSTTIDNCIRDGCGNVPRTLLLTWILVMVSPVSTAWPMSRLRSLSSKFRLRQQQTEFNSNNKQVRLRCQGYVHEPRGRPGRCCAFRFRSSGQGG